VLTLTGSDTGSRISDRWDARRECAGGNECVAAAEGSFGVDGTLSVLEGRAG